MAPFLTALALTIMLNLRLASSSPHPVALYYVAMQLLLITFGGAYEKMILSDYGFISKDGRHYLFCLGDAIAESAFGTRKLTKGGKFMR
mmetsp:Transcript_30623/g.40747  ORF Transcript_30623/g.40747 Transcript_30623/m.40747 type:complete len:89 (+) Transcript_30623:559-825(+)